MHVSLLARVSVATALLAVPVLAGVPIPDTVLYGWVFIDRQSQGTGNDVSVVARVDVDRPPLGNFPSDEDSQGQIVGRYRLGEKQSAGDRYVLNISLESLADSSTQGDRAAVVGQTVKIYVQRGTAPEQHVSDYLISAAGRIEQLDLGDHTLGDWDYDSRITLNDYASFASCMQGPGNSTTSQCLATFDFDRDEDVDLEDHVQWQSAFAGK